MIACTVNQDTATLSSPSAASRPWSAPCAVWACTSTIPTAARLATQALRVRMSLPARLVHHYGRLASAATPPGYDVSQPGYAAFQVSRNAASLAETSARNMGCSSIDGADLVRAAAAADADVLDPEVARRPGKERHLHARAPEGLQREREDPLHSLGPQALHRGRIRGCPVGRRLRGSRAGDGIPDLSQQREHRLRPAVAVEADDRGAFGGENAAGLRVLIAVARPFRLGSGERHHRRQTQPAHDLQRDQRLAEIVIGLGDDEVDALVHRPAQLLGVGGTDHIAGRRIVRVVDPGIADVARYQRVALLRDLAGDPDRVPVHRFQGALAADGPQLLPMRVVGERDHHLRARAQELPSAPDQSY